ncbi:MAG: GTPase ObgE, partial [Actinobacteria bacterium]|nr:GTPase ObgE [Actinomycetota bacterium]
MPACPQNFFDEARIAVRGGRGGDGVAHFRREKYVPRGGPDGGDGGRGGWVILRARANLAALTAFQYQQRFEAGDGTHGERSQRHGRDGRSLTIDVPCGTVVYDADSGALLADLVAEGDTATVVKGGRGGWGNVHFKSSRFQAPELALRGEPGEARTLRLELELIADAGLVGAPNAGKSSLLSVVSAARPKIAPYPFTTLEPVLGVVALNDASFVLADLPGLIDGAGRGAGLGFQFLRHVRRARVLIHLVDGAGLDRDPVAAYDAIRRELVTFDPSLSERPEIVAFNKLDLAEARARWPDFRAALDARGRRAAAISTATGEGVRELVEQTAQRLAE